jgi:hypothetical protein
VVWEGLGQVTERMAQDFVMTRTKSEGKEIIFFLCSGIMRNHDDTAWSVCLSQQENAQLRRGVKPHSATKIDQGARQAAKVGRSSNRRVATNRTFGSTLG